MCLQLDWIELHRKKQCRINHSERLLQFLFMCVFLIIQMCCITYLWVTLEIVADHTIYSRFVFNIAVFFSFWNPLIKTSPCFVGRTRQVRQPRKVSCLQKYAFQFEASEKKYGSVRNRRFPANVGAIVTPRRACIPWAMSVERKQKPNKQKKTDSFTFLKKKMFIFASCCLFMLLVMQ